MDSMNFLSIKAALQQAEEEGISVGHLQPSAVPHPVPHQDIHPVPLQDINPQELTLTQCHEFIRILFAQVRRAQEVATAAEQKASKAMEFSTGLWNERPTDVAATATETHSGAVGPAAEDLEA